jgi:hypothetical protein
VTGPSATRGAAANDSILIKSMRSRATDRHAARMHLRRIDHVSLDVRNRLHWTAWYEQVRGLGPAGAPGPVDEPVFLGRPGARLGLLSRNARPACAISRSRPTPSGSGARSTGLQRDPAEPAAERSSSKAAAWS